MTTQKVPLLTTTTPGGWSWSHLVKRGTILRIKDIEGGANVGMLLWAAWNTKERFNMADTLKAQQISRYLPGCVLYSDMGRILFSVLDSNLDWHDALGGMGYPGLADAKFGPKNYQEHRNAYHRDLATGLLSETLRQGLGKTDLHSNINWFTKVAVDQEGRFTFVPGHSAPGSWVSLRAEMDTLVVLCAAPHPLDTATTWSPKPVEISLYPGSPAGPDDPCRLRCPENQRGFLNTEEFHL